MVVGGEARVTEVQLKLPTIIGRGRSAGLTLPHPLVSRQHCEIYEEEGKLVVNDLGSLNGTFVGDQRINEPTFLMPGELLTVGTVTFRASYEVDGEIADEATGTELSGDAPAADATVEYEQTVDVASVEALEEIDEAVPVEDDIVEVVEEVEPVEELAEVEEVEAVEEVEEVEEIAVPDTAEYDTTESPGDDEDDLQSFLKGLG